jgi:aldehyde:ferredoxin oxidoreductase
VLRDKKIKAIVVRYSETGGDSNGAANLELIRKAGQRINKEITDFDASQNDMRHTGTPYLVEIMNRFDLLPVQNFRYGADPKRTASAGEIWKGMFDTSPGWLLVWLHHVVRAQRAALSPAHRAVPGPGGAGRWP